VEDTLFLNDNAPCYKAKATHALLDTEKIDHLDFYKFGRHPGNSPDLNSAENLGAIVIQKVVSRLKK